MLLKDYLYKNNLTNREFGKRLKVGENHVTSIKNGRHTPSIKLAMEIIKITNGEVTPEDLYPELFEVYLRSKA